MKIIKTIPCILFPLFAVIIIILSLYPKLPEPPVPWNFFDKIEHLLAYSILSASGILFFRKTVQSVPAGFIINCAACIILGGAIELIQPLTGRHAELMDFVMNAVGVGIGSVFCLLLAKRLQ